MTNADSDPSRRGEPSDQDTGASVGQDRLAQQLSVLAKSLAKQPDLQSTLDAVVRAAVDTVPGAMEASISEIQRRRDVKTLAATGELARAVDHAQYDFAEGPCLDSLYDQHTIRLADIHAERRWPRFVARARELGVGSMLAVQLFVDGEDLGALNLFSRQVDSFNDESEHVALLFASHAAVAMSGERVRGHLQAAVSTREVIGQAQGILMERFKVTGEMAFHMLMLASQDSNRKLRDIADELVSTGRLPGPEASPRLRPRPES
ncbi:MAG TPA: GAF and ANTAR domain-containing protein [Jatrophihabitans sp.]|jgi:transcriptional regulator with GAF, ATPase, and Fis domain|uniref:GAF and ANTAR domain-containing protein n=1 Tax=Jatrophihabitans sp. TaxID=1932789 RepID=UPI002EEA8C91